MYLEILSKLNLLDKSDTVLIRSRTNPVSYIGLLTALVDTPNIEQAAISLERTRDALAKWLERNPTVFGAKPKDIHWRTYLLSVIDMKFCPECSNIKAHSEYYINPNQAGGYTAVCAACQNYLSSQRDKVEKFKKAKLARTVRYKLNKIRAIPAWADLEKIKQIYINCPKGYHVDHIVPLNSPLVCGLHVESNLQYLLAEDNIKKSNKFLIE